MGLKHVRAVGPVDGDLLSAEPLVGLKPRNGNDRDPERTLSAEPLVGLKQNPFRRSDLSSPLSAEPLVGLKLVIRDERQHDGQPFSRTPRGFEARRLRGSSETPELSAEPLVGLKPFDSNDLVVLQSGLDFAAGTLN